MIAKTLAAGSSILALSVALSTAVSAAENAPSALEASPDVYKILAENDQWRVIEATWQPGQEDNFHSHPADRVSLYTTDCKLRLSNPDGTYKDVSLKAGAASARTGKPVASHKAKNTGDEVCVIKIVELK
jgi:quercetin dioxygenase-like cupin family protein